MHLHFPIQWNTQKLVMGYSAGKLMMYICQRKLISSTTYDLIKLMTQVHHNEWPALSSAVWLVEFLLLGNWYQVLPKHQLFGLVEFSCATVTMSLQEAVTYMGTVNNSNKTWRVPICVVYNNNKQVKKPLWRPWSSHTCVVFQRSTIMHRNSKTNKSDVL